MLVGYGIAGAFSAGNRARRFLRHCKTALEFACAGIWDQRVFKQAVIRGYAPPLKQARPLSNFASRLTGGIRLPAIGETLANAFVLNLTAPENPKDLIQLLKTLLGIAAMRGIELLTLGFAANDLRLSKVRQRFSVP